MMDLYTQGNQCNKVKTMLKNNLIALLDQPVLKLTSYLIRMQGKATVTRSGGGFKFWNCECVCGISRGNSRINTSVGASGTNAITTLIWQRISTLPLVGTSVLSPPLTLKRLSSSIAWFSIYNKRRRLVAAPNSGYGSKSNTQTQRNILSKILIFFVFLSSVA
jgi:hypothetical protein